MRQIKFRAWDCVTKTMYYTTKDQTVWCGGSGVSINSNSGQIASLHTDYAMQFTGLLDKNGNEIYEGDIVKGVHFTKVSSLQGNKLMDAVDMWQGYVIWQESSCRWVVQENDVRSSLMLAIHSYEILGNIHENPELLTVPSAAQNGGK